MDKLKKYNQIILAIAGTIGLIILLVIGAFAIIELSASYLRSSNNDYNGILAIEETNQLLQDSLRKQIISFNKIQVVDSVAQIYLLPVTQANLADAESTNGVLGLLDSKSTGKSYERFYGNIYNNLIIYDLTNATTKMVFDKRISIEDFIIHKNNKDTYIVIPGCSIDSNDDKFLNSEDLQELFIYDLKNDTLSKIRAMENYTTIRAFQAPMSNELVVHFGIDRNKNGVFERSKEPMIYYYIDFENMEIKEFVSVSQIQELQNLLEGK